MSCGTYASIMQTPTTSTGELPLDISASRIRYLFELDISNNKHIGGFPKMCFSSTTTNSHSSFQKISAPHVPFISLLPTTSSAVPFQEVSAVPRNLLEVLFLNNELEGCLPYEIGKLNKAVVFDVGGNKLTGPIPHSFACLEKMDSLNLAVNEFYGPVPEMVCDLPRLTNLSLSHNYFTQVGPQCMKLIKKKTLDVRMNCILGLPGQRSAAECANILL
uniref:Uncharacterized protein n=1 Tax=Salix viminalis TaxID=40686 RepID=A0A6N2L4Q2_SALVM